MSIIVDENRCIFQLNTEKSTYQMEVDSIGTLFHTYYGERLDTQDNLLYTLFRRVRGHAANPAEKADPEVVDVIDRSYCMEIFPQEMSAFGLGDTRSTGVYVRQADGTRALQLRYAGYRIYDEKYAIPELPASYDDLGDCKTLEIQTIDIPTKTIVKLLYGVFEKANIITRTTIIENGAQETMMVEKCASAHVDFTTGDFDMIDFYGSWARERTPERRHVQHGMQSVGSIRGESSAIFNPSMILLDHMATETQGNAYGFSFVYSGNHLIEVEKSVDDQTRVIIGIHPEDFEWQLKPGEKFFAPEVVMTYSNTGISGVSLAFHDFIQKSIVRGPWRDKKRPVLLNSWEGVYFNFDGQKLINMAKDAAEHGIELFVVDDGWFGSRNNDKSGLGDWYPNEQKLGMTLKELGEGIRKVGAQFGLWFEPEMIQKDSDLYRKHPDWALAIPGRAPHFSRNQLLLDMSRRDVQDYLIEVMSGAVREGGLAYIKWDYNRSIADRYSALLPAEQQGELTHRFIMGTYRVLETLLQRFPELLIEGCSSGGARFDMGMLYYTPQIWLSDDSDAIERLDIQYGSSMIYPPRTMGAHVSAVPNHQTGRTTPMMTRATVALSGTFGYELDINKMTEEEKEEMQFELELYHKFYDLTQFGNYYRLIPPTNDTVTVWEHAKKDGSEALISIVFQHVRPCQIGQRFYVQGLKDDAKYRVCAVRKEILERMGPLYTRRIYDGSMVVSGKTLRLAGLNAPLIERKQDQDYNSMQIHITEVTEA